MERSVRLWAFRIATAIAVPPALMVAAEGGLRLFGVGYRSDFTVPCTAQGRPAFCENDRFTMQFFPPGLFRLPYSFAIPADKAPGTFRIFVVGESAAQGVPEPAYGFSRYLEVMLRDRFPGLAFEVVNTGISSINSHVLLPIVRDLVRRKPDLFVLYIGNNEVVGPYGPQTTLTPRVSSLSFIRAAILLKSTRLGQLLAGSTQRSSAGGAPQEWRGIRMFLDHQVPADAPALASVHRNFDRNLTDIVTVARRAGVPVLLSTLGANLKDCAPFASQHRRDLTPADSQAWQARVDQGEALEEGGQAAGALQRYLSAAAIDDRHAELQFRIGRVHWTLGQYAQARDRFSRARDLDALRFRADHRINTIIRSVASAAGPGVTLVDAESLFADASPQGAAGSELFYEHVHMNPKGNYLLARTLFRKVAALLPEPRQPSEARAEPLSQVEAERRLALTAFDRKRVSHEVAGWLSQPPFTYQLNHDQQLRDLEREVAGGGDDRETATAYQWAIARAPRDHWLRFNYGVFLEGRDPAWSAAQFQVALDLLPNDYRTREKVVDAFLRMGRLDEALAQSRELLRRMPYNAQAFTTVGYILTQAGLLNESIAAYRSAIALEPGVAVDAYNQIGIIQLHQGRAADAVVTFQQAMRLDVGAAKTAELQQNLQYAREELVTKDGD
jgi:tetratricopeptide (TPR) repeat protein